VAAGANTVLCGRRQKHLEQASTEAGGGAVWMIDVAEEEGVERLGDEARRFGPVDAVVATVGAAPLKRIETLTQADWLSLLKTNVVGINCAITALLPALADGALVIALSSEAVMMPRWALAAYGASKAALEASFAGWRVEYPRLRFGTVGVGSTFPTDFARDFDMNLLGTALEVWMRHGQAQEALMDSDHVGQVLVGMLAALLPFPGVNMEHIVLRTPSPVLGTSELTGAFAPG
jgi:NAD(P)-dependent dehydrogenase (short-subunit alcohol dehydrogenase family)